MHLRHGVHKSYKVKRIRDSAVNPWGTVVSKVHRLRSSAITLDSPGMCETSSSIPVLVAKVAKISTKKHKGLVVVNILLLTDSAPVLSLRDFRQIGILKPGKNDAASQTNPIWAKVSKDEIFFCIAESIGNGRN